MNDPRSKMRQAVVFEAPGQVRVVEEPRPQPAAGELLIRTECSGISAGTELLLYRGQFPPSLPIDATIESLPGDFSYPVRYGYATVGSVTAAGNQQDQEWVGRRVFAFEPHQSYFVARPHQLTAIPADLSMEAAIFIPNLETALTLIMDGRPMIGERVAVIGLGVVGLLTTALLRRHPLAEVVAFDIDAKRRSRAAALGVDRVLDPAELATAKMSGGYDLIFELSGSPAALNTAVELCGFASRIVVGSWYGTKQSPLALGGAFHRQRLRVMSSQVSTIAPELSGRWDKGRRRAQAIAMAADLPCTSWITHRFPIRAAAEAYRILDQQLDSPLQVLFQYDETGQEQGVP